MKITKDEFTDILRENERRLWHICRSYMTNSADREDLYQEIVLQVWRSLPSFDGKAELSTWIYRIGINTAISYTRKRNTREKYHSAYEKEQKQQNHSKYSDKKFRDDERVEELYRAIGSLNASEKAIITMYLEEFSYSEIAYALDITENYVGVKLNRIKKKLSKQMEG